jgi:DNA-binding MarR family transcriptional regulator
MEQCHDTSAQASTAYRSRVDRTQVLFDLLRSLPQPVELPAEVLARRAGCHEATVRRAVTRLEGQGLVRVERLRGVPLRVTCGGRP